MGRDDRTYEKSPRSRGLFQREGGELDLTVATFDGTLREGVILEVAVELKRQPRITMVDSPALTFVLAFNVFSFCDGWVSSRR